METTHSRSRRSPARRAAGILIVVTGLLAACSTGVADEDGWRKAVEQGYPCNELLDIAAGLPDDVDRDVVDADLRRLGCGPQP